MFSKCKGRPEAMVRFPPLWYWDHRFESWKQPIYNKRVGLQTSNSPHILYQEKPYALHYFLRVLLKVEAVTMSIYGASCFVMKYALCEACQPEWASYKLFSLLFLSVYLLSILVSYKPEWASYKLFSFLQVKRKELA